MLFDWSVIWRNSGPLLYGLGLSVWISVVGFALSAALGLVLVALQRSRSLLLRAPADFWVATVRAIPLLIIIFWLYYAASSARIVTLSEMQAGIVSLALVGSGYMAEVYRGALNSVDSGQAEAAKAIGLRRMDSFFRVVFPQAFRAVVPPAVNVFVVLLKGATLVSLIGLRDMFYIARSAAANQFQPFELFTAAAALTITMVILISGASYLLERYLTPNAGRSGTIGPVRATIQ